MDRFFLLSFGYAAGYGAHFRAYTDPLNSSNSLLPPAIPPPPPPPPLNIPPSRARQLLAARLAMNKRNAEAAEQEGKDAGADSQVDGAFDGDVGSASLPASSSKSLADTLDPTNSEPLRNPFADDEDDEIDGDDDNDDDDDDIGMGRSDVGRVGLGWNRGGWWRNMVRRDRNATDSSAADATAFDKFGDGRDDSSDDGNSSGDDKRGDVDDVDDVDDDEEFGDFAMPETDSASSTNPKRNSGGLLFDRDRDTILFKPLALHPTTPSSSSTGLSGTTATAGGSLWRLGFLGAGSTSPPSGNFASQPDSSAKDDELEVLGEDGHRVARVTEAASRTSLEDPDEDEVVL